MHFGNLIVYCIMELQILLKSIFEYKDGILIYRIRKGKMIVGSIAGCKTDRGYHIISFVNKLYYRHQLNFLYHHGYIPKCIDHFDGNTLNDRIENLKDVSQRENTRNRKIDKRNKTGYRGVSIWKNKFVAHIMADKRKYLGTFNTAKEASIAYEGAAKIIQGSHYRERGICAI